MSPPHLLLRVLLLGVLDRCGSARFTFLAFITRKSFSGAPPFTVAEQVHALVWLIDQGSVQMQGWWQRDGFRAPKREVLGFSLASRGRTFVGVK